MSKRSVLPQFYSTILPSKHLSYLSSLVFGPSKYWFLTPPRRWMDFQQSLSSETLNHQECPAGAWSSVVSSSHSSRFCCQSRRICPVKAESKGQISGLGKKSDIVSLGEKSELYLIEEHQQIQAQWSVGGLALVWPEAEFICRGIVGDCTICF